MKSIKSYLPEYFTEILLIGVAQAVFKVATVVALLYIPIYNYSHLFDVSWKMVFASFVLCQWRVFCEHAGGHRYFTHQGYQSTKLWELIFTATIENTGYDSLPYWLYLHSWHHVHCENIDLDIHSPDITPFFHILTGNPFGLSAPVLSNPEFLKEAAHRAERTPAHIKTQFHKYFPIRMWLKHFYPMDLFYCMAYCNIATVWWIGLLPRVYTCIMTNATSCAAHVFGTQPFVDLKAPACHGMNCWWLAWFQGEGWHNNHHAFPRSCMHGFPGAQGIYQFDWIYQGLRVLQFIGLIDRLVLINPDVVKAEYNPEAQAALKNVYLMKARGWAGEVRGLGAVQTSLKAE